MKGLACRLTLCILKQMLCNFTSSVQISLTQTLKLIAFSWIICWCWWQNVLMIKWKNIFNGSWLFGLLSAEIFISTGELGVQMPTLTEENSPFLWSGNQEVSMVMVSLQMCLLVVKEFVLIPMLSFSPVADIKLRIMLLSSSSSKSTNLFLVYAWKQAIALM